MRHRCAVGLHEQVVDEVDTQVDVLQPRELVDLRGLGVSGAEQVHGIEAVPAARELGTQVGREDLLPTVVTLERREVSCPDEPLRPVVEARTRVGAREPLHERPGGACQAADPGGEQVGSVRVVAGEELVASFAGKGHLHVRCGELRDKVGRERGRVRERLVERLCERGQEERRVSAQHELAVLRSVALRNATCVRELVERTFLETDRECPQRFGALLCRERRKERRVDAPGKEDADGHVADQVRAHGIA